MNQTTQSKGPKWTNYGSFSIHWGKDDKVAHINSHYRKKWVVTKTDDKHEWMNSYQYFLYRRALFGLDVYSRSEIEYLSWKKRKRVISVHKHATFVLNMYKQRIITYMTNRIFRKLFPEKETKGFFTTREGVYIPNAEYDYRDEKFECNITFKELEVNRKMIVGELMEQRCLPWNFLELTVNDDPRIIRLKEPQRPIDQL